MGNSLIQLPSVNCSMFSGNPPTCRIAHPLRALPAIPGRDNDRNTNIRSSIGVSPRSSCVRGGRNQPSCKMLIVRLCFPHPESRAFPLPCTAQLLLLMKGSLLLKGPSPTRSAAIFRGSHICASIGGNHNPQCPCSQSTTHKKKTPWRSSGGHHASGRRLTVGTQITSG